MPDLWFSYREVAFSDPECIAWIAGNINILEDGRWPQPPAGRRMTDGPINLQPTEKSKPKNRHYEPVRGKEAPFTKPEGIAAEFRRRWELVTGNDRAEKDRVLFEEHCMEGLAVDRLARIRACPYWVVDYRIKRVLKFLSGRGLHYIDGHPATYAEWMGKRGKSGHNA